MRELFTARLVEKILLSEASQCFHLNFVIDALQEFPFEPGQFVSCVAAHPVTGKPQTRAYSIASAAHKNTFALCVNRVEAGFFSNMLGDLEAGGTIEMYGPNGDFTLREPLADSLFIATGTGVAPMCGFAQWLFPEGGPDRSQGKQFSLIYGTRHEADIYYRSYFEQLAARHPNFKYLPTLSRAPESWTGERGYVQEHVARLLAGRTPPDPAQGPPFDIYAYVCGLSEMVHATRDLLRSLGWHRKQVVQERFD